MLPAWEWSPGCAPSWLALAAMAAHSFVWVRVHCIWTTYRRQPWLDPDWRHRLYRYLSGVARRKGALLLCAGGVRDHIHLYVSLPPDRSLASLVNALKANSCRWIHASFLRHRLFAWQTGYAAFSVSKHSEQRLISYILNQEKHHRQEELRREDRKSTRLNSSHGYISYAVFCLKKKKNMTEKRSCT